MTDFLRPNLRELGPYATRLAHTDIELKRRERLGIPGYSQPVKATTKTTGKRNSSQPAADSSASVFERLSDHRNFCGSHKHRFDTHGNGLGLAGRDSIPKGRGNVHSGQRSRALLRPDTRTNDYIPKIFSEPPDMNAVKDEARNEVYLKLFVEEGYRRLEY